MQPLATIPLPGDGLPSDLLDYLIRLITNGPDDGGLGREGWSQIIPPEWRRYLSPGEELNRRLDQAGAALGRAGRAIGRAAYDEARMRALDMLVGVPCLGTAKAFVATGHPDAAALLREFVTAEGPQLREFPYDSAFSKGFGGSETTMPSTARALAKWKARPGGLHASGGTIFGLSNTFVPVAPAMRYVPGVGVVPVRIIGTPEAHVIGSYAYGGRLMGDDLAEWTATNELSLKSFFADNWTKRVNVHLVSDNARPQRYGSTKQIIRWRTDLDGEVTG